MQKCTRPKGHGCNSEKVPQGRNAKVRRGNKCTKTVVQTGTSAKNGKGQLGNSAKGQMSRSAKGQKDERTTVQKSGSAKRQLGKNTKGAIRQQCQLCKRATEQQCESAIGQRFTNAKVQSTNGQGGVGA